MSDLRTFFKGDTWLQSKFTEDGFVGRTYCYSANVKQSGISFYYKIWSLDDPSISEDGVSDTPLKAIVDYLSEDLPGSEFYERMSSGDTPGLISSALRFTAAMPMVSAISLLRRAFVLISAAQCFPYLSILAKAESVAGLEAVEIEKLRKEMKSKGWEVSVNEDDHGLPVLSVNMNDLFEATIEVESILYDYKYGVTDRPDLADEGVTDDPIRDFQNFYRDPERSDVCENIYEQKTEKKTVAPGRGMPQERETISEEGETVPSVRGGA